MIKVFIPTTKGRVKSNVRGFWYSKDSHKIFYDYLKVINTYNLNTWILEDLRVKYRQEALFYVRFNCGYIYNGLNKGITILPSRIYKEVLRANLRQEIKEALKVYGGVTIYQEGNKYFKEIFYK
jgi:hypothetical protein